MLMQYKESINNANLSYVQIATSSALLPSLPMPYKESINNANIAYVRITYLRITTTICALHVDLFSYFHKLKLYEM